MAKKAKGARSEQRLRQLTAYVISQTPLQIVKGDQRREWKANRSRA